ncbi:MAG: type II toxin-antitoxin system death-on-curing family toxin [Deltaproteobacteria bacterium]|nr:type II toxin-antitoxin system death-on-curing family toxin [Deltaproteobacteria bacterium]MBN2674345.1 type II toxin-antitoxin system death-on-curing family toxin [Deltaproteobacteria bacterium]
MNFPVWIRDDVVLALHERQLAEHGGARDIRDTGLLDSALNALRQLFHYKKADLHHLAAAYGFSLASNHPFVDGNKRTAYVCMRLFLCLNGLDIVATKEQKIRVMLDLARGKIDTEALADWLRKHSD